MNSALIPLIAAILVSYLIGSISGSLLLGRLRGVDIRTLGSGNAGATNALRTQGVGFAIGTALIDIGKGAIAALLIARWAQPQLQSLASYACALAVTLGHCFPVFFGFRGGKGAGTGVGSLIGLQPIAALCALLAWLLVVTLSGFVGLSTVVACIVAALSIIWLGALHGAPLRLVLAMLALIVLLHRGNLQRLMRGTEPRFERARLLRRRSAD